MNQYNFWTIAPIFNILFIILFNYVAFRCKNEYSMANIGEENKFFFNLYERMLKYSEYEQIIWSKDFESPAKTLFYENVSHRVHSLYHLQRCLRPIHDNAKSIKKL